MYIQQILTILYRVTVGLCFLLFALQTAVLVFGKRHRRCGKRKWLCTVLLLVAMLVIPSKLFARLDIMPPVSNGNAPQFGWPTYYNQDDPAWGKELYGESDYIADTGCGPTVLAMVVSTLGDTKINPKQMADWAYQNGYYSQGFGSYHTLIAQGLAAYGIETTTTNDDTQVKEALQAGYPVIALMGEGHFTGSGHFLLLYDIDDKNKVSLADPKSEENSRMKWDLSTITAEAKVSPTTNGAYWIIQKQVLD